MYYCLNLALGEMLDSENVALYALHHWQEVPEVGTELVPAHVERRTLYNPEHPGVDMVSFPQSVSWSKTIHEPEFPADSDFRGRWICGWTFS